MSESTVAIDGAALAAASLDGVGVVDGTAYAYANDRLADVHGYASGEELVGRSWQELYDPVAGSTDAADLLSRARAAGEWRGGVTARTRRGDDVPAELSMRTTDGGVVCVVRDRADQRERERELERYETIIETVDDGVYVLNEDLRVELANERFFRMMEQFGFSREAVREMHAHDLVADEDERAALEAAIEGAIEDEPHTGSFEMSAETPAGETVVCESRFRLYPEPDGEHRGCIGILRDITDRKERERELRAARRFNEELVQNAPFGMFRLDEDLRITYENPRAEEIIGLPDDEAESAAIGVDIRELPSIVETGKADVFSRLQDGETIEFEFPFESIYGREAYFTGRGVPLYRDGEFAGAVLMATDISEHRQHERDLERQRDELETLDRINELILEITRDLFDSPTRTEIEQTVCDRLAGSELYQFAWIGEPESGGRRIVPRASAGIDDGYVEQITVTTAEAESGRGPGGRALRTGTVQVSQDVRSDPTFEPWREQALDRGVRSAAAIPLVYGETTYGILAVYATRPLGFSHREQAAFETLGEAVGFAVNAIENRRLLFADTVVELEVEVADPGLVFVRVAEQLACSVTITGYVESASGTWSVYLTVDGASPPSVRDVAADDPDVDRIRVIAAEDDAGVLEFVMKGSALREITEHGAILTSGTAEDGRGRFCIEAPQTADVRRLVDRLQAAYPDSTVVAQREYDRPVRKAGELRESIEDRLTDRQREALYRAAHAGYFEWPRTSTAGEVAESMDIAETTFHYHLRNALSKLLSELTDSDPTVPR